MQSPPLDHTGSIYGPATLVGATQPAPRDPRLKHLISQAERRARGQRREDIGALKGARLTLVFNARRPSIPVTSWADIEAAGNHGIVLVSLKFENSASIIPVKSAEVLAR